MIRWYSGFTLPNGTTAPRLRCRCPLTGSGWHTPDARAWQETDAGLVAAGYSPPAGYDEGAA